MQQLHIKQHTVAPAQQIFKVLRTDLQAKKGKRIPVCTDLMELAWIEDAQIAGGGRDCFAACDQGALPVDGKEKFKIIVEMRRKIVQGRCREAVQGGIRMLYDLKVNSIGHFVQLLRQNCKNGESKKRRLCRLLRNTSVKYEDNRG